MPNKLNIAFLANLLRRALDTKYERLPKRVAGRLGDGTTTERVDVLGSTIHVYFRPMLSETTEIWEVLHTTASIPRWHNWPVICIFNERIQKWEVYATDTDALPGLFESFDFRYVTEHASQHIINEDAAGHDPVWVYRRAIVNLRPRPPPDSSFRIFVDNGTLPFADNPLWVGEYGPDLSLYVPNSGEVWVTHYIREDGKISATVGAVHPISMRHLVSPPAPPPGTVQVAFVALTSSLTTIGEADIWDGRELWAPTQIVSMLEEQIVELHNRIDGLIIRITEGDI